MKTKRTTPLSKLAKLTLALALLVQIVPAVRQAAAGTNPCPTSACRYTYDPVENCCNPDPRFDCVSICF